MNKIEVPNFEDAIIKAFQDLDDNAMDEIDNIIDGIYNKLFDDLRNNIIDGFYYNSGNEKGNYIQYTFTRSIRKSGITKTCLLYSKGEIIPLYHNDYSNYSDMRKDCNTCADNVTVYTYMLNEI